MRTLREGWLAYAGAAAAGAGLVATGLLAGAELDVAWAPTLGARLAFALDGIGVLYAGLATGIGAVVLVYAARYVPLHLDHQGRPRREATRLYAFLLLFMVSMVGLVTAQDLLLLFVFWDLTAVASYFLIAFDRHERNARYAALMALLVTAITAVFLLVAAVLLHHEYGTFSLPELFAVAEPGPTVTTAAVLIALAALAKSAQVPFHFWLPRAMAAPTPVSAYLHSAAMVAAGVFLLARTYPLLEQSRLLLDGLLVVGMLSMAVGGVLALTRDELKQVLANSTIAQYGYVTFMLGIGGASGVAAASFYVLAHALMKSALFLAAGAVSETTGETRLSRLGGLGRDRPLLAAGTGLAAAGLGALPFTAGFFKDELFFAAALERGPAFGAVAVASAALTLAYAGRFWLGIFTGRARGERRRVPALLVWPTVLLGALVLVGGVAVEPLARLANAAASVSFGATIDSIPSYHLDLRAENAMALATYAAGIALLVTSRLWSPFAEAAARVGERVGPERWYDLALLGLNQLSDLIHDVEVRDLRTRVAAVLVPAGVLVALGTVATPAAYELGTVGRGDVALVLVLAVAAVAAVATTLPRHHLTLVLILSTLGFSLAVAYAFFGAPDVALVAVLVETIFALLFLGVFALMPRLVLRREAALPTRPNRRWRDPLVAAVAGFFAFVVVWGALSRPAPEESVAAEHTRLAPEAHGSDVVTVILADFRGLDTLGEITVVAVALVGIAALLRRGRLW
ncbi:MAG TPA: hydrogen gas-evolving membrane-bound hydrogenase subunit E [Gaiellaceae bacterium]|nr:hydrogen gas-evolving membrane-bound hydrogenase subunit E [Gaiellaceae bacterium]